MFSYINRPLLNGYDKLKGKYDEKLKEVDQSQDECNEKNDTNQNSEENNLEIPINSINYSSSD